MQSPNIAALLILFLFPESSCYASLTQASEVNATCYDLRSCGTSLEVYVMADLEHSLEILKYPADCRDDLCPLVRVRGYWA